MTIEKSLDISESEDFKLIKQQNESLIVEAEKQRVERVEYTALSADYQALKQDLEKTKELLQAAIGVANDYSKKLPKQQTKPLNEDPLKDIDKHEVDEEFLTDEQIEEINKPENQ